MAIVGNTYEILKKSPLFNLSLASKELFHSNFIAWYAENYRDKFIEFINEHLPEDKRVWSQGLDGTWKVLRESNNFDICIKDARGVIRLIIENKVKSIPYKEQLDEYKNEIQNSIIGMSLSFNSNPFRGKKDYCYKSLKGQLPECQEPEIFENENYKACLSELNNVAYILLSLSTDFPDRDDIEKDWTIINYGDLAMYLKNKHNYKVDYKDQLVLDYADFITNLQELEKHWAEETAKENLDGTTFLLNFKADKVDQVQSNEDDGHRNESESDNPVGNTSEYERAKELRIHDLYGKTRAQRICMLLQKELDAMISNGEILKEKLSVSWGFTNGTPVLEVKMLAKDVTNLVPRQEYDEIFIQIQGNQYRHAVNLVNRVNDKSEPFSVQTQKSVKLSDSGKAYLTKYKKFFEAFPDGKKIVNGKEIALLDKGKQYSTENNAIKDYCQYGGHPNGGLISFVYYYKKISPYATIQDILNIIVSDVKNNDQDIVESQ